MEIVYKEESQRELQAGWGRLYKVRLSIDRYTEHDSTHVTVYQALYSGWFTFVFSVISFNDMLFYR